MKKRDLFNVGIIFTLIVAVISIIMLNVKLDHKQNEIIKVKKFAIYLYEDREIFIDMVHSLNKHSDNIESDIKNMNYLKRLLDDLKTVRPDLRSLTLAVCYDESNLNYNVVHKGKFDKSTLGICGVKSEWIDMIPQLTKENINTLYGGSLVLSYLLDNSSDKFEAIKKYKGSILNVEPVVHTLALEKMISL